MILAQRILDTLRANGPIAAGEFPRWFGGIDRIDLDAEVSRLLRKNSISFALNKYDVVAQKVNGHKPFISRADAAPAGEPVSQLGCNRDTVPTAAEEVAASLKPGWAYCLSCNTTHPENEFPRNGKSGKLYTRCKRSYGAMAAKGRQAKKQAREQVNGADPATGQGGEVAREAGSLHAEEKGETIPGISAPVKAKAVKPDSPANMAGGRANTTAEDSSILWGESSGSDRLPPLDTTPPLPPGSTEPPATSSEHLSEHSAHGTTLTDVVTENPEALSPVGAADPVFAAITERFKALVAQMHMHYDAYEAAADAVHEFADALHRLDRQVREELGLEEGE